MRHDHGNDGDRVGRRLPSRPGTKTLSPIVSLSILCRPSTVDHGTTFRRAEPPRSNISAGRFVDSRTLRLHPGPGRHAQEEMNPIRIALW